jgi:hypothetical protein
VRLVKPMQHDNRTRPAGLVWRKEFIKSTYEPGKAAPTEHEHVYVCQVCSAPHPGNA